MWYKCLIVLLLASADCVKAQPFQFVRVNFDATRGSESSSYKAPSDGLVGAGLAGYIVGAGAGGYGAYQLLGSPSTVEVKHASLLWIGAAAMTGGALSSAVVVHVYEGGEGNLALTTGSALLSQVVTVGVAGGVLLLARLTKSEGLAWFGALLSMGGPFAAILTTHYVDYKTSR